jgi:hypothetical protein
MKESWMQDKMKQIKITVHTKTLKNNWSALRKTF